ncbi:hypothetical protein ACS0TY_035633 [Phlomoides rotata]
MFCSLDALLVPGPACLSLRTHNGRIGKSSPVQFMPSKARTKVKCSLSSMAMKPLAPVPLMAGGTSSLLANMLAMGAQMMMHYLGLGEGIKATLPAPVMKACPFLALAHGVAAAAVVGLSLIGLHVIIRLAVKKCVAGRAMKKCAAGRRTGTSGTNLICIHNNGNWQGNVVVKNKETGPDVLPPS